MAVKIEKSKVLAIGITADKHVTEAEVQEVATDLGLLPFLCDACGVWRGATLRAVQQHKARFCAKAENATEEGKTVITEIVDDAVTVHGRWYRIVWQGCEQQSWEPEWELCGNELHVGSAAEAVVEYWEKKQAGEITAPPKGGNCLPRCEGGEQQCRYCCWWGPSTVSDMPWIKEDHGRKIHEARWCKFRPRERGLASLTAKKLREVRLTEQASGMPKVKCCEFDQGTETWVMRELEFVAKFVYLGVLVQGGEREGEDIKHRLDMATAEFQKHRSIWKSNVLAGGQKLEIYKLYIVTKGTHGFEGWCLDEDAQAAVNHFNARCLSQMLSKDIHEMASYAKTKEVVQSDGTVLTVARKAPPYDLLTDLRKRRLQWCGHVARMDRERMEFRALRDIYILRDEWSRVRGKRGRALDFTVLMDAPETRNFEELCEKASDRKEWRKRVKELNPRAGEKDCMNLTRRQHGQPSV